MKFDHNSFFQILQRGISGNVSLPKWLSEHLDISESSAYRKISGERGLQLEEMLLLCASVPEAAMMAAELFPKHHLKVIQVYQFKDAHSFHRYLENTTQLIQKASKQSTMRFRYVARDIPFFYFLSHPITLRYKFRQWAALDPSPSLPELSDETHLLATQLWEHYLSLPSEELWLDRAFGAQYAQLKLEVESGQLRSEWAQCIAQHFEWLEGEQKEWKNKLQKTKGGECLIARFEAMHLNNGALLETSDQALLLGAINGAHYLHSSNPGLIQGFRRQWLQQLKLRAAENRLMIERCLGGKEEKH